MQQLRTMHLFAGAGGGMLADLLLDHKPVCAVEIDSYCQQVLSQRQKDGILPWFPIFGDVTKFNGKPWRGIVDCISGGFPCQAFSTATRGRSVAENMWPEMLRIVGEVRPKYVFAENVDEKPILIAQRDLDGCGFKTLRAKLSAKNLGADHIRDRWWLLAHADDNGKFCSEINAKTQIMQKFCNCFWEAEPEKFRVFDGVAHRMDRLKAIGNGQVSIVAATAFQELMRRVNDH